MEPPDDPLAVKDGLEELCEEPCHPASGCPRCAEYWSMMRAQGFWTDEGGGRWTNKGWAQIVRDAKLS